MGILTNQRRNRPLPERPARVAEHDGLAYALFLPDGEPLAGVLVLHGAGSSKESHFDFCRAARGAGMAAIAFDMRGHGDSPGSFGAGALDDIATMAGLLPGAPLALRGSSMGGYLALLGAARLNAAAVVAICPAGAEGMLRGLRGGHLDFAVDPPAMERFLETNDLNETVAGLDSPMLLMHARGDEVVPVEHSEALLRAARMPVKRLIAVPGGHHRSIQHDPELQGESLRFVARAVRSAGG